MGIKSTHPSHDAIAPIWELVKDVYGGEISVKDKTVKYLPATSGQVYDGMGGAKADSLGHKAYYSYLLRAVCPDLYRKAVETAIGTMHRKDPVIKLPKSMQHLEEHATESGESLKMVLRKINEAQITTGRIGVLGDLVKSPETKEVLGKLSLYCEESIRNWNLGTAEPGELAELDLVILDETSHVMNPEFEWEIKEKYRILAKTSGDSEGSGLSYDPTGKFYATATMDASGTLETAVDAVIPNRLGSQLEKIPFSFINTIDVVAAPCSPPMLGLALLVLAIYRGEADYRQSLFMQGQDTLVRIGIDTDPDNKVDDDTVRTGAGARIDVPMNGDAKYIGVASEGLGEQRSSLENDYIRAEKLSGQLNDTSKQKEAADALRRRTSAQTASLPQIALSGAAGLEDVLKFMAPWFGANPDEIEIIPNMDFTDDEFDGSTLVDMLKAKTLGAKLSDESIHEWMVEQGITKLSFEEEMAKLALEEPELEDEDEFDSPAANKAPTKDE